MGCMCATTNKQPDDHFRRNISKRATQMRLCFPLSSSYLATCFFRFNASFVARFLHTQYALYNPILLYQLSIYAPPTNPSRPPPPLPLPAGISSSRSLNVKTFFVFFSSPSSPSWRGVGARRRRIVGSVGKLVKIALLWGERGSSTSKAEATSRPCGVGGWVGGWVEEKAMSRMHCGVLRVGGWVGGRGTYRKLLLEVLGA